MPEYHHLIHPISPFYDQNSNILILGSFPSPKSRESGFFYGHPQNRFWKVMAGLFQDKTASTIPEKQARLLGFDSCLRYCRCQRRIDQKCGSERPESHSAFCSHPRRLYQWKKIARNLSEILSAPDQPAGYLPAFHQPRQCRLVFGEADQSVEEDSDRLLNGYTNEACRSASLQKDSRLANRLSFCISATLFTSAWLIVSMDNLLPAACLDLELACLRRFFDGNRKGNGCADHRIVAHADQAHHFHMCRYGRGTRELRIGVHSS